MVQAIYVNMKLLAKDATRLVGTGDIIVVVDVLRCTSSIITALANGATCILPVRTVKEARQRHKENPTFLLAGERRGLKPKGFDLGNSPSAFINNRVRGNTIILTTTSGTTTIHHVKSCKHVFFGALLNAQSVAEKAYTFAKSENCGITFALSGTKGRFSLEDFLGAGAIIASFPKERIEYSDTAYASVLAFNKAKPELLTHIQMGNHARTLKNLGLENDVFFCSSLNKYTVVPYLNQNLVFPS